MLMSGNKGSFAGDIPCKLFSTLISPSHPPLSLLVTSPVSPFLSSAVQYLSNLSLRKTRRRRILHPIENDHFPLARGGRYWQQGERRHASSPLTPKEREEQMSRGSGGMD